MKLLSCVYEPCQFSRSGILLQGFARALKNFPVSYGLRLVHLKEFPATKIWQVSSFIHSP
jgi:hypothetical protein